MSDEVKMIPIDQIHILNPRHRDRKKFEVIVQSIKNLGLKKPIQISPRSANETEKQAYDLICGQGRIEAFKALGHNEIPAIIVEISKEERMVRSLVENIARRYPVPMDLIREIERLKTQGYNLHQIGIKLNVRDEMVRGLAALKKDGEERLLEAAVTGKIPLWVAIDIAKTDTVEMQRELLKAYENKQLNYLSIRTVKRIIEQRRLIGKQRGGRIRGQRARTSAESLVSAYRRESQRQKLLVKKAKICEARLLFIVTAFGKLLADENFVTLLRAESVASMPKSLWEKITPQQKEAA